MSRVPLISIIIPTYNYGNFVLAALSSIAEQHFTDWECIVIDDGSTDDTTQQVTSFISTYTDQDFRYVYTENAGTSAAKNKGIDLARGKYLQFLDADDLLSPMKLSVQVNLLEKGNCALVYSKTIFFRDSPTGEVILNKYPSGFLRMETLSGFRLLSALIVNNIVTISSPLVRKDLVIKAGKFTSTIRNNEDWLFWFRIAMLKPIFVFDDDSSSYTKVRIHASSAMRNNKNMFSGEVTVREQIGEDLIKRFKGDEKDVLMKKNLDQLALHRIRSLDWTNGWRYILGCMSKDPAGNLSVFKRACYQTLVRMFRIIVPVYGD